MAPILVKSLSRLSRESLLDLCQKWSKSSKCAPYLTTNRNLHESEEEDYLHEPAENRRDLKHLYRSLKEDDQDENVDRLSKRDIIDRIVDGDWRRGLSYHQLATIDFAFLEQNDTAMRWTALKLVPLQQCHNDESHPAKRRKTCASTDDLHYPEISPASFLERLKSVVSPIVKAHYHFHRLASHDGLTIIRLLIMPDTPFAPRDVNVPRNTKASAESARTMYIALPRACPYIYVSVSGATGTSKSKERSKQDATKVDIATTKRIVLEAIPKALSKPQQRWALETTKLTAKSLRSIALLRGSGRPGTSGGAYSHFNALQNNVANSSRITKSVSVGGDSARSAMACAEQTPAVIQTFSTLHIGLASSVLEKKVERRFGLMTSSEDDSNRAHLDQFHVQIQDLRQSVPTETSSQSLSAATASRTTRKRKRLTDIEAEHDTASYEQDEVHVPAPVLMHFQGMDVFKGIKQLAFLGPEFVDLDRLPAWMTGEKGVSNITV